MNDIEATFLSHTYTVTRDWSHWFHSNENEPVEIPGLGTVTVEKRHIGWDTDSYMILRIENDGETRYYKKTFDESSFGIDNYGPFNEVKPNVKTITEFN